jgi:hypothetical protein
MQTDIIIKEINEMTDAKKFKMSRNDIKSTGIAVEDLKRTDKCCLTCWISYPVDSGEVACGFLCEGKCKSIFIQLNNICQYWVECPEGEFFDYREFDRNEKIIIQFEEFTEIKQDED